MSGTPGLESDRDLAACLGLLKLPGMGPRRARWLIEHVGATAAWDAMRMGRLPVETSTAPPGVDVRMVGRWQDQARTIDARAALDRHRTAGIQVIAPIDPLWPFGLDPDPPLLLFAKGHWDAIAGAAAPAVAVIGTRRCTTVGRRVAHDLGSGLASAGIPVVSGLALGIDGAAHTGALTDTVNAKARPIAVVATGLDRVYPPGNRVLWEEVIEHGLLLSEAPLGTAPERWRFPARNRLIAGLASLVVVVESHARGGALHTVDEAAERGKPVAAVPGSVLSAASAGTNALLCDGCTPVRSVLDVLALLGWEGGDRAGSRGGGHTGARVLPGVDDLGRLVLEQLDGGEVHLDHLVAVTGHGLREVVQAVGALVAEGLATLDGNRVSYGDRL